MESYDAVIKNEGKQDTPRMSTEEWIEKKKRERADLHAIANEMADKALTEPDTLAAYLTLQARLGRCSLNNALLVLSQKPDATFVCDAKAWQDRGRGIRKGEGKNAIKQFQQDKEYIREDGSAAMGYKVVRCFDISQTYGKPVRQRVVLTMDMKEKIKALTTNTPVPIKLTDDVPQSVGAIYSEQENAIHVARGVEGGALFFTVARELARANGCNDTFLCDCVANIACIRFGVEPKFCDRIPEDVVLMEHGDKKATLAAVRESANEIVGRVDRNLYAMWQQQKNQPER